MSKYLTKYLLLEAPTQTSRAYVGDSTIHATAQAKEVVTMISSTTVVAAGADSFRLRSDVWLRLPLQLGRAYVQARAESVALDAAGGCRLSLG